MTRFLEIWVWVVCLSILGVSVGFVPIGLSILLTGHHGYGLILELFLIITGAVAFFISRRDESKNND